ncbi:EAL domain, c-di-GMP-specific phosphodiesterase class I (or its enzymatically inactive variant) [Desulfurobacterium pacificum]|uniref:EAL domain, c-di-GMP-specific phosphodiesterase class I (Or its enzymatically inactive variant) n=1 Tax=Desulfurobacterium pacificum TaxID=240166 RepID=A0ABY1NG03_9BACT|nr:GGDEF domain-containing protein [Desulfurobacterium pacificum]SMP08153.1 EAL domain, c-di-GMP-specific phosphodiesterase class I (or its enzymatically inactive variant) [Desulfurobacterium pacificum]
MGSQSLKLLGKLRELFSKLLLSVSELSVPEEVVLHMIDGLRKIPPFTSPSLSLIVLEDKSVKFISSSDCSFQKVLDALIEKLSSVGVEIRKESVKTFTLEGKSEKSPENYLLIPLSIDAKNLDFYLSVGFNDQEPPDVSAFSFLLSFLSFLYLYGLENRSPVSVIPGFLNRDVAIELVRRLVETKKSLTAVIIDINDLNLINMRFGNLVGNRVINFVGNVFKEVLEKAGSEFICGYLGSGQFLFVCEKDVDECYELLKDKTSFLVMPENFSVGVSMAILDLGSVAESPEDVERIIFMSLEKLKEEGRSAILKIREREEFGERFFRKFDCFVCIKEKVLNREVIPVFQPIFDMKREEIYGYEVLSRFEEDGELKSVYVYADVLDRLNLWQELDKIVLSEIPKWKEEIEELKGKKLFVNLSGKFLSNPQNREFLLSVSEELPAEEIVFEVTEREYVKDMASVVDLFNKLKVKGFEFAIDDFASGFSGFDYVKKLHPTYIKLDGSLIRNLAFSKEDEIIVSAVKYVCDNLNITLLAEWIENEKVYKLLKEMNVELGQGYFLSPPLRLLGR